MASQTSAEPIPMQESWVQVQDQQSQGGTGKLMTHTSSTEEMKQLLASAASEEEQELSDSDVMYQVTFHTSEDVPEKDEDILTQVPSLKPTHKAPKIPYQSHIPSIGSIPTSEPTRSFGDGICSLSLLVPVIILTHLAMFGIGYYLGRRWTGDPTASVMRVFHV